MVAFEYSSFRFLSSDNSSCLDLGEQHIGFAPLRMKSPHSRGTRMKMAFFDSAVSSIFIKRKWNVLPSAKILDFGFNNTVPSICFCWRFYLT